MNHEFDRSSSNIFHLATGIIDTYCHSIVFSPHTTTLLSLMECATRPVSCRSYLNSKAMLILSGCVALLWCIITLRFTSSSLNVWLTFQAKNNVRSTPASTALLHQSHNAHTTNCHLCSKGEMNGLQRWALVEPWCKHCSCCSWRKHMSPDEVMLKSKEISLYL